MDNRQILKAVKKVAPSPPSIGSGSSGVSRKLKPPPAPSIGSGSVASVSSSGAGSKRGSETSHRSGRSGSAKRSRSSLYPESESSDDEPDITPENRLKLIKEQSRILWIKANRVNWKLHYNNLLLGRKIDHIEPENYVYTTFCRSDLLQKLMDLKYKIRSNGADKFFELRAKLSSFVGMEGIIFHNPEAIRMANIDALMGYQLSNPKNFRGESLLGPNELLYFVDIYGAPGGAAEYFLWKKQWNAHGFGFTSKQLDYDLPVKPHYSAESFEAVYGFHGKKGQGDIYNPDEVDFFMRYVRKSTGFTGAHICIAQGGEMSIGDEDRKELRAKYLLMSEFMIALDVLREGGHFVCKIYDMFTSFTVGLIYLMYRTFDSVAIFKPETCLPASSDRYILCKYRKANRNILEIRRFLMDTLTAYRNSQRLSKGPNDDVADIIELVPFEAIRQSYSFYDHILSANVA
ncbi:unnamed protein product [Allacma fusca]|uniref:Cap-specific mRNA (nucleoside-2'-O-)-methyltransferase 1 n=1 Tax=Allacma fusca TaxID=39272 RepID=A0A8J2NSF9_9HEXA|nr:unnamed protein product [Allacma fusca]